MRAHVVVSCLMLGLALCSGQSGGGTSTGLPPVPIGYTLLDGSYFVDDCLVCGRPTILQPLRGTFDLVLVQDTPPFTQYAIRNLALTASPGFAGEVKITGGGTYRRFEEFAVIQSMELATEVRDRYTNQLARFTNDASVVTTPFPQIEISLTQTNGTLLRTFRLHLIAAPVREVWFSINRSLTTTNMAGAVVNVSPGDLLSGSGHVVKRNIDLVGRLGVMPIVPDLGLDAVEVTRRGEILFSILQDVFSETLGPIQHGDVLSSRGRIVKRNQELLAAFGVMPTSMDAGLDAIELMPDGEILFSIRKTGPVGTNPPLGHGDLLSDHGRVVRTHRQLLEKFHPVAADKDYGLDAVSVLPDGQIWFSVEEGFTDSVLGEILPGDLLSDRGYRVLRNAALVAPFGLVDPTMDYGLDALFVVNCLGPPHPPPRFLRLWREAGTHRMCLEWDGEGRVFQVERALGPSGPWEPCSSIQPDLTFEDDCKSGDCGPFLYRLRQW